MRGKEDVGHQASGQHQVRTSLGKHCLHHLERISYLGTAQHEHAWTRGLFHQGRYRAVLLLEEPSHATGKKLLESAERGLIPVGSRKGIAHVQISQRGELGHDLRLGLVLMGQTELGLEKRLLLGHEPHVVQKQDLSVLKA